MLHVAPPGVPRVPVAVNPVDPALTTDAVFGPGSHFVIKPPSEGSPKTNADAEFPARGHVRNAKATITESLFTLSPPFS
jgi:hypothetical protein